MTTVARVALYDLKLPDERQIRAVYVSAIRSGKRRKSGGDIRLREEIAEQHRALGQIKEMAAKYGCDNISGGD